MWCAQEVCVKRHFLIMAVNISRSDSTDSCGDFAPDEQLDRVFSKERRHVVYAGADKRQVLDGSQNENSLNQSKWCAFMA